MHKKILHHINTYNLIPKNSSIVVGFSGGPDSTFLVHTLLTLQKPLAISQLHLAHINHNQRGRESRVDQQFCENFAKKHNLKIHTTQQSSKKSSEEQLRNIRYTFFNHVKEKTGANLIATGHTANDQIETFLLFLLRGAGLNGLSGIKNTQSIIRPLLHTPKSDIITFLNKKNISFRVDKSNHKNIYTRNKIRNTIIPLLKEINPNIEKTLGSTTHTIQITNTALETLIKEKLSEINYQKLQREISINLKLFTNQDKSVQQLILSHILLKELQIKNIRKNNIETILSKIQSPQKNLIFSPKEGLQLVKSHDKITLCF